MAKKRVRVRVKKYRREVVVKKRYGHGSIIAVIFYMAVVSLLTSLMIARCPSPIFVEDQTGRGPRREKEMQVTIFAGQASYRHHAMESLTLRHENGAEFPINAKDIDKGMQVLLDGKFRYVIEVKA